VKNKRTERSLMHLGEKTIRGIDNNIGACLLNPFFCLGIQAVAIAMLFGIFDGVLALMLIDD
jgi:hypothetical protein